MKIYTLKERYPGSPKLESIIRFGSDDYYIVKPNLYPTLWEESEPKCFTEKISTDGTTCLIGDIVCYVDETTLLVHSSVVTPYFLENLENRKFFAHRKNADDYIISLINLQLYDGLVVGENIPIYSLLIKSGWDCRETTSLELAQKSKKSPLSESWLFFKNSLLREEYIKFHKPEYSLSDINHACVKARVCNSMFCTIQEFLIEGK